jgi:ABC-2 type transport system permease protein
MLNFKNILTITKKEINSFLNNPASYIVVIVFTLLWEFLFFKQVFLVGQASLRGLYDYLPWLMLILVPAITMGSIAKEKDEGTLELLLTHPVREIELIIGKFLGSLLFTLIPLVFALPIAFSLGKFGRFDWGVFSGQFIGSILFAAAMISLGVFISGLLSSQIAALLVTAFVGFFLIIMGSDFFLANLPLSTVPLFENLSVLTHVDSISRGVLDFRDVWYFISFIVVFLSLTYLQLLKRKFGNNKAKFRKFQIGILLFVGIAVLTNVVGNRIPGRIDLTQNRVYTLSGSTQKTLKSLNDIVTVTLYASGKLPAQYSPILRDTKDMLSDYRNTARGNIVVKIKDPSGNPAVEQEAASQGIQQVQFNVIGQEEFQLKTGYMGLVISYAGKNEVIPFIQSASDLEYKLTSAIKKLTIKNKKVVGFLGGQGEKELLSDYSAFDQELSTQFETRTLTLDKDNPQIADDVSVLVVAGPAAAIDDKTKAAIKAYLDKGKSALFLIDNYIVDVSQSLSVFPNANSFAEFLNDYGLTVNKDVVYDLRLNESVRFGNGTVSYYLPYPFWVKSLPADKANQITNGIDTISLPWTSSILVDSSKVSQLGLTVANLLATTPYAGAESGSVNINPDHQFAQSGLGTKVLAVSLSPKDPNSKTLPKIVVVGNSQFLSNQFMQNSTSNLAFGINAISWLGQEDSMADIKVKNDSSGTLVFSNPMQASIIKYLNMAAVVVVSVLLGIVKIFERKNLAAKKYRH